MTSASKLKQQFQCRNCGAVSPRWQGQCASCQEWNQLEAIQVSTAKRSEYAPENVTKPTLISELSFQEEQYLSTDIFELDRVLGQGFVRGSVVLLGGEPGIGKSTLSLQLAQSLSKKGCSVMIISGEESTNQLLLRANRLGESGPDLMVYSEVDLIKILQAIKQHKPELIILDSIQVVYHPDVPSVAGSVNQVRYCASELIRCLKNLGITGLFIGHINKEGALAGPKVLEHLVDVILYMEGESNQNYRLLRSFKNRYASTHELGIFEMKKQGLEGVSNPSSLFLDENTLAHSGTMVCPIAEGSRIILVEVQALVVETGYGMAKRTFLGVDPNRVNLLIATMEKLLNIKLANKDIILNIVGGLKIGEPALDLAIVLAIISSLHEKAMGVRMAAVGEVGLTGEIRPIPHSENRLVECEKMGFKKCILPHKNVLPNWDGQIERVPVESLQDAIRVFLRG